MNTKSFLLSLLLFAGIVAGASRLSAQQPKPADKDMPAEILRLVNEYRQGKGLKPLRVNYYLTKAAETHSSAMATRKIPVGHEHFDKRMAELAKKIHPANAFGENIACGTMTGQEAMDMWLKSDDHRANIEGKYTLTGIGVAKGANDSLYFTQIFLYQKSDN